MTGYAGGAARLRRRWVPTNSWVEVQLPHEGRFPVGVEMEGSEDR